MAIAAEGDYQNFSCTGGMQSFTAPIDGVYKLEAWGAGGGGPYGGAGGYSYGHVKLKKGEVIYVCVGASFQEADKAGATYTTTPYNGGGAATFDNMDGAWPGGGATHMASVTGTIKAIGAGNKAKLYIVAGGGGGGTEDDAYKGGAGGGANGAAGASSYTTAAGGTQTAGGAGQRNPSDGAPVESAVAARSGSFGQGGTGGYSAHELWHGCGGGGGGGLYGGAGGTPYTSVPGGGGSGYIGGVAVVSHMGKSYGRGTTAGGGMGAATDGRARITFVARGTIPVAFDGTVLQKLYFNGTEIGRLIYNGTAVFMRRMRRLKRAWL